MILEDAKRGGLKETIAGKPCDLLLTHAEVERFEDRHRGIFAVWEGFLGQGIKPTLTEVRDLVALGLVGGGTSEAAARRIMAECGMDAARDLYQIAQALVGVAFMPDLRFDEDDPPPDQDPDPAKKKTAPPPGTSAPS